MFFMHKREIVLGTRDKIQEALLNQDVYLKYCFLTKAYCWKNNRPLFRNNTKILNFGGSRESGHRPQLDLL